MLAGVMCEMNMDHLVAVLRAGGVVACATETSFGLLADAADARAVARIVEMKGRAADQTIACIAPSTAIAAQHLELNDDAWSLADQHWPGPLTLVGVSRLPLAAPVLKEGRLGVRVPGASPAADLVWAYGALLTATSANRTGEEPALDAATVRETFGDAIDAIVDLPAPGGAPSTVVTVVGGGLQVLRRGAIEVVSTGRAGG